MARRFFNNLIYKYYRLAINLGNEGFYPEVNAWFLATVVIWFNFLTCLLLLQDSEIITKSFLSIAIYASFAFWIATFFHYVIKRKYRAVVSKYEIEPEALKKKKSIWIGFYTVISIIVYFYVSR